MNCHAPTEESESDVKDEFYAQLEAVMDAIPDGHLRILLGDMNAKVGKEQVFQDTTGRRSLHDPTIMG